MSTFFPDQTFVSPNINLLWGHVLSQKNMGPIASSGMTFMDTKKILILFVKLLIFLLILLELVVLILFLLF